MAGNTGKSYRKGAVTGRTQLEHPKKKGMFLKRDTKTGRFMSSKTSPYKGIKKENSKKK